MGYLKRVGIGSGIIWYKAYWYRIGVESCIINREFQFQRNIRGNRRVTIATCDLPSKAT